MGISISTKNDNDFRRVVVLLLNSLRANIDSNPITNDYTKIKSFTNYIFSRFIDKLSTISANYIRIEWIIGKMKFTEIDNIFTDDKEKLNNESQIELITTILRPLTEIYIEIKSIELSKNKFNFEIEDSCRLLYYDSLTEAYQLKRSISAEIYNCEPKYFKLWYENNFKELNKIKQQLAAKDILLLKNVKNKYKSILENYGKTERLVLGFDYLTHYAVLSKKAHFSYTNIPFSNLKPNVYLSWCLLYILLIYEHIMRLINKSDDTLETIKPYIEFFIDKSSNSEVNLFNVGDYILVEYGVARIKDIKDLTYEIEYYVSNCFNTNEIDFLPKIFVIGKVDFDFLEITKRKYYLSDLKIYQDDKFESFYMDVYNHCNPKCVDLNEIKNSH